MTSRESDPSKVFAFVFPEIAFRSSDRLKPGRSSIAFNTFIPNPELKPERSVGYEAGVRLKFEDVATRGDRLTFNAHIIQTGTTSYRLTSRTTRRKETRPA